jgi:hypothetical protein
MTVIKSKNEQLVELYFQSEGNGQYKCLCGTYRKRKKGCGWTNLIGHIISHHPDYNEKLNQSVTQNMAMFVDKKSLNAYGWIDLVVARNYPLQEVDSVEVRKYSKLQPISYRTLKEHMSAVVIEVESIISTKLPAKFGIVFDGWSSNGNHYVALFAGMHSYSSSL